MPIPKTSLSRSFFLEFDGLLFDEAELQDLVMNVVSVTLPSLSFSYDPDLGCGKSVWLPITLTLRNDIAGITKKAIDAMIDLSESGKFFDLTTNLVAINSAIPKEDIIETWKISKCRINNLYYGTLSCDSNKPDIVSFEIGYEVAEILADYIPLDKSFSM